MATPSKTAKFTEAKAKTHKQVVVPTEAAFTI